MTFEERLASAGLTVAEMISHFRTKCRACGHHRIMHDEFGRCEGVMNRPCGSGCDRFQPE